MTDELIRRLIVADLSKQQASSVTAETLVNLFMPDDGKKLILAAEKPGNRDEHNSPGDEGSIP